MITKANEASIQRSTRGGIKYQSHWIVFPTYAKVMGLTAWRSISDRWTYFKHVGAEHLRNGFHGGRCSPP